MSAPAARLNDMHSCPMVTGIVPHVGGVITAPGSRNVFIAGLPAARVTDQCACVGPPDVIVKGSLGVFINGLAAARVGDTTAHGGVIVVGAPRVLIGDAGQSGGPSISAAKTKVTVGGSGDYSKRIQDDAAKARAAISVKVERAIDAHARKYGTDDFGLTLARGEAKASAEASFDLDKKRLNVTPLDARAKFVGAEAKAKGNALNNLLNGEVKVEAASAEVYAKAGLKADATQLSASAGAGASAIAAKAEGKAGIRITPKTMYDNTIGRITGSKLSPRFDKGVSVDVTGTAGVGAAAEANAEFTAAAGKLETLLETKVGAGPLLGIALRIAVLW